MYRVVTHHHFNIHILSPKINERYGRLFPNRIRHRQPTISHTHRNAVVHPWECWNELLMSFLASTCYLVARPSIESCIWSDLISVAYARWCHWKCGRAQPLESRLQPTINLHAQVTAFLFAQLFRCLCLIRMGVPRCCTKSDNKLSFCLNKDHVKLATGTVK